VRVGCSATATMTDADRAELEQLVRQPRVVAVGETGLDYYWTQHDPRCSPPEAQQDAYRWHIDLAKRVGKPLMIHDRDAHGDVLAVLEQEGPPQTVIFHCFSGDATMARSCVDAGYVLSFSGTVTFRNAHALREAAMLVPDGQLLVETDAPFLTPHPHRGRPNEPVNLPYTVRDLAALRGQDVAELAASSCANAARVFGFGPPVTESDFSATDAAERS
jgi:TatD DNase family protein